MWGCDVRMWWCKQMWCDARMWADVMWFDLIAYAMVKHPTTSILFYSPLRCLVTTLSALVYCSLSIYAYCYYTLGKLSFVSSHLNFFSCRNLFISRLLSTIHRELEKNNWSFVRIYQMEVCRFVKTFSKTVMKNTIKLLVVTFHILYSILCNYLFLCGEMSDGALPLVLMINLITIMWIIAVRLIK